mmetsp:Transcript_100406/g.161864  ORF Transcript_100406/g.161864 Transcript_100406/m.161864 type:complete len:246 (+) Transcript_100406:2153-2890(+)
MTEDLLGIIIMGLLLLTTAGAMDLRRRVAMARHRRVTRMPRPTDTLLHIMDTHRTHPRLAETLMRTRRTLDGGTRAILRHPTTDTILSTPQHMKNNSSSSNSSSSSSNTTRNRHSTRRRSKLAVRRVSIPSMLLSCRRRLDVEVFTAFLAQAFTACVASACLASAATCMVCLGSNLHGALMSQSCFAVCVTRRSATPCVSLQRARSRTKRHRNGLGRAVMTGRFGQATHHLTCRGVCCGLCGLFA